jgi:23S rRNA-/tRNA-specific pseudouridylate synthase
MDASALAGAILYEDDAVIVFDKPAGLAVQGGSGLSRHVDGMLAARRQRRSRAARAASDAGPGSAGWCEAPLILHET